jgi:hypothetical protein
MVNLLHNLLHLIVIPVVGQYRQVLGEVVVGFLDHSPQSFLRAVKDVDHVCTDTRINIVSKKEESVHSSLEESLLTNASMAMSWTLHSNQVWQFLGLDKQSNNIRRQSFRDKPSCQSISAIHSSITSSYTNRSCIIPWLSPAGVCHVMQMYSHIRWWGDSLTRHTVQGLFMTLSGNFRYGGFPNVPEMSNIIYSRCSCDGQFSESTMCRDFGAGKLVIPDDARKLGFCRHAKFFSPFSFTWFSSLPDGTLKSDTSFLCTNDSKPKFLYLQGGAHFATNAETFLYLLVLPIFESINRTVNSCPYNVSSSIRIAMSGVNICDKSVSAKYPMQSDANSIRFTRRLVELLREKYPLVPVVVIDFLSITGEAIADGRTSDGYHFLSDINLIKAMTILNVMRAMAEDPAFQVPFKIGPSIAKWKLRRPGRTYS